jgi:hypothetical protein
MIKERKNGSKEMRSERVIERSNEKMNKSIKVA